MIVIDIICWTLLTIGVIGWLFQPRVYTIVRGEDGHYYRVRIK
jgi:hypothetical protein